MDTDATEDQRALLDVSARFMDERCPLDVVRNGAWRDEAFAAVSPAVRRAGLVLDAGARVPRWGVPLGQRCARRRSDRLCPGRPPAARLLRRHQRGGRRRGHRRQRRACDNWCCPPAVGEVSASWAVPVPARRGRRRGQAQVLDDGGLELSASRPRCRTSNASSWLLVTCQSPTGPAQALVAADAAGRHGHPARIARLSRRFAEVRFDGVVGARGRGAGLTGRRCRVGRPAAGRGRGAHRGGDRSERWITSSR